MGASITPTGESVPGIYHYCCITFAFRASATRSLFAECDLFLLLVRANLGCGEAHLSRAENCQVPRSARDRHEVRLGHIALNRKFLHSVRKGAKCESPIN